MNDQALLAASLIESFDYMDPTRSHESVPSARLRELYRWRRFVRDIAKVSALVALLTALLAVLNQ